MLLFLNQNPNIKIFFNALLALIPISFILGNMAININLLLIVISGLILFRGSIFKIKFYKLDNLIFAYFFLVLFTAVFNDYKLSQNLICGKENFQTILKSILFFKYLLLYLVLRFLFEKNIIDLKLFFVTSSISVLFVSLDLFYQSIFGFDIFGYESLADGRKLSGPFGDEYIAGGYLQRFSLFAFFLIPLFYSRYNSISKIVVPLLVIVFLLAIILSGNRMPMILFIFTLCLVLIFQKQTRKFFLPFILTFSIIFFLVFNVNQSVKTNFKNFYKQISNMYVIVVNKDFESNQTPQYLKEFSTFYNTWLMNKYVGGGIKNFRCYCHHRPNLDKNSEFICNMHPHNYYLEILTETGIIGFSILSIIFITVLYLSFFKKYITQNSLKNNNLIVPFIFLFFAEIFPIKSTGSFFTTGNTTYLILIMSILIALIRKDNLIENKSQK
tara:strand:+ start:124 stop:1449 length:1326 start_codon:yes stop_codon:yes gene_type:complete